MHRTLIAVGKIPGAPVITVYKGVFNFFETHGLPLDIIFDLFRQKNCMVSWMDFYCEAISAGMSHQRILSKLEESICDVWGKEFFNVVEEKLNKIYLPETISEKVIIPDKIIILNRVSKVAATLPMKVFDDEM